MQRWVNEHEIEGRGELAECQGDGGDEEDHGYLEDCPPFVRRSGRRAVRRS